MEGKVRFDSDYRWKDVERLFDLLEKIIEMEKSVDRDDDVADFEWFDPLRCEYKADRFLKWLGIGNDDPKWNITMVVNESKSRFELWLNSNGTIAPHEEPDFWCIVPPGTFMPGGAATKKFGKVLPEFEAVCLAKNE